jgi:hypothetical protein
MNEQARSEQACPVCSQHTLALDQPPQIDIMGVQSYSDILGMGDLRTEGRLGIICLSCGTRWRDKAAFDRGEAEPAEDGQTEEDGADESFDEDAFDAEADEDDFEAEDPEAEGSDTEGGHGRR